MAIKLCKSPEKFKSTNVQIFGIIDKSELEPRPWICKNTGS